jgi:hypothetical protein
MTVFDLLESTPMFSFTAMTIFTAAGAEVNLNADILAGLDGAAQFALREQVSNVTLSAMAHPDKVFSGCRSHMKNLASAMYALPRDPGLGGFALVLSSLLTPNDRMSKCKPAPSELKSVRFNSPGNPVHLTKHSCDDFFASLRYEMLFDILESDLRIEYEWQVAKKDLAEWLRDFRQV